MARRIEEHGSVEKADPSLLDEQLPSVRIAREDTVCRNPKPMPPFGKIEAFSWKITLRIEKSAFYNNAGSESAPQVKHVPTVLFSIKLEALTAGRLPGFSVLNVSPTTDDGFRVLCPLRLQLRPPLE